MSWEKTLEELKESGEISPKVALFLTEEKNSDIRRKLIESLEKKGKSTAAKRLNIALLQQEELQEVTEKSKDLGYPFAENVKSFPRLTRKLIDVRESGEGPTAGDVKDVFVTAGADLLSKPGRFFSEALSGTPQEVIRAPEFTQTGEERSFLGTLADDIARDPTTMIGGPASGVAKAGVKKLPMLAGQTIGKKVARGAATGGGVAGLELLAESQIRQAQGEEQLTPAQNLVGLAMGSGLGAGGGFVSGKFGRIKGDDLTPAETAQKQMQDIQDYQRSVPKQTQQALSQLDDPRLAVGFVGPDGDFDVPYDELLSYTQKKKINPFEDGTRKLKTEPLELVYQRVGKPAIEEFNKIRSDVGQRIGKVREKYLPQINSIYKSDMLQTFNDKLGKPLGLTIEEGIENGKKTYYFTDAAGDIETDVSPNMKKILGFFSRYGNEINPKQIEAVRKKLDNLKFDDPNMPSPEDKALMDVKSSLKDYIDDQIVNLSETKGLKLSEDALNFKQLRADYAKMSENKKRLNKLLGDKIGDTNIRGSATTKRTVQSISDGGASKVWSYINELTGYDLQRNAARAITAMAETGDFRGQALLQQMGEIAKATKDQVSIGGDIMGTVKGVGSLAKKGLGAVKEQVSPSMLPSLQAAEALKNAQMYQKPSTPFLGWLAEKYPDAGVTASGFTVPLLSTLTGGN